MSSIRKRLEQALQDRGMSASDLAAEVVARVTEVGSHFPPLVLNPYRGLDQHRTWLVAYREKSEGASKIIDGKSLSTNAAMQHSKDWQEGTAAQVAKDTGVTKRAVNASITRTAEAAGKTRKEFDHASADEKPYQERTRGGARYPFMV